MKHVAWERCPACQEPVHPVAGRCKHCKADLVTIRAEAIAAARRAAAQARAAAATPLRVAAETSRVAKAPGAAPRREPPPASASSATRKLALVAAAVLLAGVAGGVVAQKLYARTAAAPANAVRHADMDSVVAAPPDHDAPAAGAPDFTDPFQGPFADPDPTPHRGGGNGAQDPMNDPDLDPFDLMRRLMPGFPRDPSTPGNIPAPRRAPGAPLPDVSDVRYFLPAMIDVACGKLAECGVLDAASSGMCRMMASGLADDDTVDRVHRGECRYDADAARQCLSALGGMTCDSTADPGQLLGLTGRIASCSRTLDCP
jgi:hypothetical protein